MQRRHFIDRRQLGILSLAGALAVWLGPERAKAQLPPPTSPTLRSVLEAKRLRVGMAAGFAPFVVAGTGCDELIGLVAEDPPRRHTAVNGTNVAGLDVDLAKAVAEALGVPLEVHLTPTFREIFAPLGSGQVDVAISGITRTLERARSLSFSQPYLVSGQKLLVKEEARFASIEAANRKEVRIGFKSGTTGESFVRESLSAASLVAFPNSDELFRALEADNLEAAIADSLVGRDMVVRKKVKSELHAVGGKRLTSESICMAARQSDGDWTDFLSLVVRELKTSGQFHRLVRRYNPWLRIQRG